MFHVNKGSSNKMVNDKTCDHHICDTNAKSLKAHQGHGTSRMDKIRETYRNNQEVLSQDKRDFCLYTMFV